MKKNVTGRVALLIVAALQGCNGVQVNLLESVEPAVGQSPALDHQLMFHVNGSGTCGRIAIDWGDGATEETTNCRDNTDASGRKQFQCNVTHVFSGWGGGKTVTATAKAGCEGRVNTRFVINPSVNKFALNRPGPNVCDPVPNRPALAKRTLVKITTVPTHTRCGGIWYNNVNPHCYDAEGGAVATLPPPPAGDPAPVFPFLGMRERSLVLRVGTQLVQGGTNMAFTTNQAGRLEACLNEPDPRAGVGGYEIHIRTDQLGPPAP
jgi:hypothetical protein